VQLYTDEDEEGIFLQVSEEVYYHDPTAHVNHERRYMTWGLGETITAWYSILKITRMLERISRLTHKSS